MKLKFAAEIKANLERARESLLAAEGLFQQKFFDASTSRAYYTVFYSSSALLLLDGLEFKKHSGLISSIHLKYVKTGRLDKKFGKDLNWLFHMRGIADYGITSHVHEKDTRKAVETAKAFLDAVVSILPA